MKLHPMRAWWLVVLLVYGAGARAGAIEDRPQRIVSINVCADQLLLELAPREAIASLSHLAASPHFSARAAQARGIAQNHGRAEEVIAFAPDLVVSGRYTTRATVALLEKLDIRVLELDLPSTLEDTRVQIRTLAAAIGRSERGEAVVAALDAALAKTAAPAGARKPVAALYRPNGFTAGPRTLAGSVLAHTGFRNLAALAGIDSWGHLPLEALLRNRPDVIVFDATLDARLDGGPSLAAQLLTHPIFRRLQRNIPTAHVPARLWGCAGPWVAQAAARLAELRSRL